MSSEQPKCDRCEATEKLCQSNYNDSELLCLKCWNRQVKVRKEIEDWEKKQRRKTGLRRIMNDGYV